MNDVCIKLLDEGRINRKLILQSKKGGRLILKLTSKALKGT